MASWLKAAEDLFEVVDKRAKLVVGENTDEQPNSQTPVSNGQRTQPRRSRTKRKPEKRASSNEKPATVENGNDKASLEASVSDPDADKNKVVSVTEKHPSGPSSSSGKVINEEPSVADGYGSTSEASLPRTISIDAMKHETNHADVTETVNNVEAAASNSNAEPTSDSISVGHRGTPSAHDNDLKVVRYDQPADSIQDIKLGDTGSPKGVVPEASQSLGAQATGETDTQSREGGLSVEPDPGQKKDPEQKTVTSAMKVQEQLDEAQGLLNSAISTGQTKEARLARVCAGLSSRLQEYKSENAQLEELLVAERELSRSYGARLKQLQKELSESKNEVNRAESNMLEALAAKNAEIEALVNSMDSVKKQAALTEGNLASLQANMESIMRNRELTETRMMQAMREELAAAERRAEEEHTAHNATKMAAMEREVELEHRAIEASTALARTQRTADERTAKAAELEQKVALLEAECSSLNQELQDMEARARRGQKKSPEEANQLIQTQAWQEEVERAWQSQREAESKLSSLEAEIQKMRVEMAAMKRDAEHYSRQEHMELEKRYRELTDLLYYKQTQLETMASEKAAAEFQLEKEMKRLQEAQLEAERNRASRRASSSYWEEDTDIKALEPLPLHNRHMAGASIQLQKAAKLLDFGAVRATRFLWRYPTARIILLFYLVFVHLFLMYLLHRLQEQADSFTSREFAASMGLVNQTLP